MTRKADNIDFLFDKKDDDNLFFLNDSILEDFNDDIELLEHKISNFINKRVHPKTRKKLSYLINKKERKIISLNCRENQLYYRNGFADGISILLTALSIK